MITMRKADYGEDVAIKVWNEEDVSGITRSLGRR